MSGSSYRSTTRSASNIRYRSGEPVCPECGTRCRSDDDLVDHLSRRHAYSAIDAREHVQEDDVLEVNPSRAFERVQGIGGDPRRLTNELPPLTLPGHGDEYDDCGDGQVHFCSGCGEMHEVGRTCRRKGCPRCAPAWCADRATAAGSKLEAFRRYLTATRGQSPKFHHLVFSPPDGFATARDDPLDTGYEIVKELLDELGVDGAVIVYHPWRGAEDDDRGFWSDLLFEGNDWSETVENLSHEPHFHVIAVADYVPGGRLTKSLYEQTGWTYKRITKGGDNSESNVSIFGKYDLARVLTYCLSHAGVSDESDAYRYTGQLHNFAAEDYIEAEIDAAVRSVAPDTLGLPHRSTTCQRTLEDDEESARSSATSTTPDQPSSDQEDTDGDDDRRCGGRLFHVSRAPEYLTDSEWRATVPTDRVDALVEAYGEWRGVDPPG